MGNYIGKLTQCTLDSTGIVNKYHVFFSVYWYPCVPCTYWWHGITHELHGNQLVPMCALHLLEAWDCPWIAWEPIGTHVCPALTGGMGLSMDCMGTK